MNEKWKAFWQKYRLVPITSDADLMFQVGKTVAGKPIAKTIFKTLVQEIVTQLQLRENDVLLDLACGNGLVTYELAKRVKRVIGIDFSKPYVKNAKKFKAAANTTYLHHDINQLKMIIKKLKRQMVTRVLIYDALAYFNPVDLEKILTELRTITQPDSKILLASILDTENKWRFYNTFMRKLDYLVRQRLLRQSKGLGTWWKQTQIEVLAQKTGWDCTILFQDARLHTAHYRFNALLERNDQ